MGYNLSWSWYVKAMVFKLQLSLESSGYLYPHALTVCIMDLL